MGHIVMMGRKTLETLPKRQLPGRVNIILSRNKDLQIPNCTVVNSVEAALRFAAMIKQPGQQLFIIGGSEIYHQTLHLASRLCLTVVEVWLAGKSNCISQYFPDFNKDHFNVENIALYPRDGSHGFHTIEYVRTKFTGASQPKLDIPFHTV